MKTGKFAPFLIIVFMSLFSGCYTVLVHPDVETTDENGYTYDNDVKFYDDCSSCHKDDVHDYIESPQILKAHPMYSNFGYYDYSDYYYNDFYFGNYGYYYNYPWWLDITTPANTYKKSEQYTGGARNNSSERSETTRERTRNIDLPSPTITPGNGETTETSSSKSNGTTSGTTVETRSTNNNNASGRSTSNTSGARNNNGERSSDTGRKR